GQPIRGLVRYETVTDAPAESLPLSRREGHGSYAPTERGEKEGVLTWRMRETDERVPLPRGQWSLERLPVPKVERGAAGPRGPGGPGAGAGGGRLPARLPLRTSLRGRRANCAGVGVRRRARPRFVLEIRHGPPEPAVRRRTAGHPAGARLRRVAERPLPAPLP